MHMNFKGEVKLEIHYQLLFKASRLHEITLLANIHKEQDRFMTYWFLNWDRKWIQPKRLGSSGCLIHY